MCEYCEWKDVGYGDMSKYPLFISDSISVDIEKTDIYSALRVLNRKRHGAALVPINYCPMCGRKL